MSSISTALSAALLHFAWQGLAVFVGLWVTLYWLRRSAAPARYLVSCLALAILALAPLVTTLVVYRPVVSGGATGVSSFSFASKAQAGRPTTQGLDWRRWVVPVWAFGVLVLSMRMVWGFAEVSKLRRRGQAADPAVLAVVANLSARMGISKRVQVLRSSWSGGPSLVGWLRPVILLPAWAVMGLTPQQLEAVLAHELAHVRRHDYLVNWMQMLVETLLFYHPAVWWVSARIRHERELCCDDRAVSACEGPLCYARALTTLEKLRATTPALAVGSTGGSLFFRIQRIVGAGQIPQQPSRASGMAALSLALACLVLSVHWARGQGQSPSPAADYLAQGDVLLRAGANDLALEKYRAGVQQEPGKRLIFQKRMIETLMRMNQRAQAFEVNAQLLAEHPEDTDGLGLRAVGMLDSGDAAGAVALLQQVLAQVPDNPVAHLDLGLAYAAQGQKDLARQQMEEAIRMRPDFVRARRALEDLDRGGNRSDQPAPPAPAPPARLGAADGNFDQALALLQAESDKAPERAELLMALANTAVRAGKYDMAIDAYQKLVDRQAPDSDRRADLLLRLGEAYRRKGDHAGAIRNLEKAQELEPRNREVLMSLVLAQEAAGLSSEALRLRREAEALQREQERTTTKFLEQEMALEQLRLAQLQRDAAPDPEKVTLAQKRVEELRERLNAARAAQGIRDSQVLAAIELRGLPETAAPELRGRLPVHLGDTLTAESLEKIIEAVRSFDSSLEVTVEGRGEGRAGVVIARPRK